jgi:hypothetical protein
MVTPGYFETLGIPRIAGNDFNRETATGPKVAIVNQAFVEQRPRRKNPIGMQVTGGVHLPDHRRRREREVAHAGRRNPPRPLSLAQANRRRAIPRSWATRLWFTPPAIPLRSLKAVRRQIYALDPAMAIYNEETMEEHIRTAFFLPRLAATLFGTFGFIGLVLAASASTAS